MVGNHVVDLRDADAQPGVRHLRFDAKAFVSAERRRIRESGAPNRLRWLLWAAKRAGYQAMRRMRRATLFAPRSFRVDLDPTLRGTVSHAESRLCVLARETADEIHVVVHAPHVPACRILDRAARLEHRPGGGNRKQQARSFACECLARVLNVAVHEVAIEDRGGAALARIADELPLPLSLSGHGEVVGFCALVPPAAAGVRSTARVGVATGSFGKSRQQRGGP